MSKRGIWLIGFRGAGKSTLGAWAAERMHRPFLDADAEWELRQGESILQFVMREGEAAFRKTEESMLREISSRLDAGEGLIVATGGGFVDHAESRKVLLASSHPKFFLDPPPEALWGRLKESEERLKIGNLTTFEAMHSLLEQRRPFYKKIASSTWKSQDISECLPALERLLEQP